jgi:hypothetical protein
MRTGLIIAIVIGLFSTPVFAQTSNCGTHEAIKNKLHEQYGEVVTSRAIDKRGNMLEMYANKKTGTWTAVKVRKNGTACGIDSGEKWKDETGPDEMGI